MFGTFKSTTALLFLGLLIFSAAVVWCAVMLPDNEKIYVFLSGIAGNFSGALFMYLKSQNSKPDGQ